MKTHTTSRRTFLVTGTALAASSALKGEAPINPAASRATANECLSKWIEAWNHHDAHQLGLLQTSDANTVNLLSTYLLMRRGKTWQIVQHDLHSVDPIKFPFKTKWNA